MRIRYRIVNWLTRKFSPKEIVNFQFAVQRAYDLVYHKKVGILVGTDTRLGCIRCPNCDNHIVLMGTASKEHNYYWGRKIIEGEHFSDGK